MNSIIQVNNKNMIINIIKKRKKTFIFLALIVIAIIVVYFLLKDEKKEQTFFEVKYGDIKRDIFETGTFKKGEEIDLGFVFGGEISDIYVTPGEEVLKGDILAKLDNDSLKLNLDRANKNLDIAKINLEKMKSGYTEEEINNYRIAVFNAEQSFLNTENIFNDLKDKLITEVRSAYTKADDTIGFRVDKFFDNPRGDNPNLNVYIEDGNNFYSFPVSQTERSKINNGKIKTEENLKKIKEIIEGDNVTSRIEEVNNYLKEILSFLDDLGSAMNSFTTYDLSYESVLTQYKNDVSLARNSISLIISNLYSYLNSFNSAKLSYDTQKGNLELSKSNLRIALEGAREEDISIQNLTINQLEIDIRSIDKQINNSIIFALSDGIITDIKKKQGENINPGEALISFIGENDYKVEVNIYEGEISKIDVKDNVIAEFVAFPYKKIEGEVSSIEPFSRIIDGVVYYKTIVYLYDVPEGAMSGMSTDLIIQTTEKEGVLTVSENSINRKDDKIFVDVLEGKELKEKEIKVGSRGDGRVIEVIEGLKEGEKVLIK